MNSFYQNQNTEKFEEIPFLYLEEFKKILVAIIECFKKSLSDYQNLKNNEETIRNLLVEKYLEEPLVREELNIEAFLFQAEPAQIKEGVTRGYLDIKVLMQQDSFKNPKKNFFTIECKRLDGNKSLNSKYIQEGILRFIQPDKYPSHYGINGMIGFLVRNFNIDSNIDNINDLIKTDQNHIIVKNCTSQSLQKFALISDFEHTYSSKHTQNNSQRENIELFHLMLDYSKFFPSKPKKKNQE